VAALDEVHRAGHRAEVDPLVRGAALDVVDVAAQRVLEELPVVLTVGVRAITQ
jgi:hypothetical protein